MNICKGICVRFKDKSYKGRNKYEIEQKGCTKYNDFIFHDDTQCPCCACKLRITPEENKSRKKLQETRNFVWI